jgi:hypothetical protein
MSSESVQGGTAGESAEFEELAHREEQRVASIFEDSDPS